MLVSAVPYKCILSRAAQRSKDDRKEAEEFENSNK